MDLFMKKKTLYAIILGASMSAASCTSFLDMTPTDSTSDRLVWSTVEYAELAVNDFYRYIDYLSGFNTGQCLAGMTEALTDQLKYGSYNYNSYCRISSEMAYGGAVLTASYVDTYLGNWSTMYEYIRRVNEGIYNLHRYGTFDPADMERIEAEMRFFRGFLYTDLIKRYKDVIIYNEDLTSITRDKNVTPEAECWNFVYSDLMYAAEHLPSGTDPDGRLTSGAAYALLSRAMLYAERWSDAKTAAEAVMAMGYDLEPNYADAFRQGSIEAILQYSYNSSTGVTHSFDGYMAPGGDRALDGNSMTGGYGTPTQEMVESYELAEGGFPDWSPWHTGEGTDQTPPYSRLEPRFAATVLYNGAQWKGRTIETFVNGTDGFAQWMTDASPEGRTVTGYYLRKLVDETHSFRTVQASTQPWTELRLAEVILNHAEASFRSGDEASANADVRRIRQRVGLPYSDLSGESLMAAIRQERKVELAFEGHYYWDMRRWRLAETAFTGIRLHGMRIEQNATGGYVYTIVECDDQNRNFPSKMYRCPIPQSELNNNGLISQFPEWN